MSDRRSPRLGFACNLYSTGAMGRPDGWCAMGRAATAASGDDGLEQDLIEAAGGRVIVDVATAADLVGLSGTRIRQMIHCGRLRASRLSANGRVMIRVRDLAALIQDGERRALPALDPEERERRIERLEARRRRRKAAAR